MNSVKNFLERIWKQQIRYTLITQHQSHTGRMKCHVNVTAPVGIIIAQQTLIAQWQLTGLQMGIQFMTSLAVI